MDKLKFFVNIDKLNEVDKDREKYLSKKGRELQLLIKKDKSELNEKVNRKGKFRSINIYERSMFDDINDMPEKILKILNKIDEV